MNSLQQIKASVEAWIERFTSVPGWKIKYALALFLLAICFATPAYRALIKAQFELDTWARVEHQIRKPFTPFPVEDINSHAGKKSFRLTVPVIARILHLNKYGIFILQNLLGIAFLYFLLKMIETVTGDRHCAFWLGLAFATIYVGRACFIDIYSWFDGWAFLFLLLAMLIRNHAGIFVCCSLAAWTDERAALALSLVFLWWWLKQREKGTPKTVWLASRWFTVALAFGAYLLGRHFLHVRYGLETPAEVANLQVFYRQMDFFAIGGWTFLEGLWLIVFAALLVLVYERRFLLTGTMLLLIAGFSLVALMVYDITRSGAYLFPLVFICLLLLKSNGISRGQLRKIVMCVATVCVIFPAIIVITALKPPAYWQKPVVAGAVKHLILRVGKWTE